ncbi:MAG: hypothetical protein M1503_07765 [Thaumarchaeota archaeon]|nr:hypothetical protein [Nitrososphaerota archaeon]MCL5318139.1 hypothetical protein [Nitrososphaerota archaeon]
MHRPTLIKIGIIAVGALLLAYAAIQRAQGNRENLVIGIGIILVLLGVVTFFIGGDREERLQDEEEPSTTTSAKVKEETAEE